jgi:hypothetical protein
MKARRRFGLALSWPRITSAFLLDVAVLILASHLRVASGLARHSWYGRASCTPSAAWWLHRDSLADIKQVARRQRYIAVCPGSFYYVLSGELWSA